MGRQTGAGAPTRAGTGSAGRLDPFALPHRFAAPDAGTDDGTRRVTLESGRVLMDRTIGRMSMRIAVPLMSFSGVAIRVAPGEKPDGDRVEVLLAHRDRALDVPLATEPFDGDGLAEWRSWARSLNLPLLIEELDGVRKTPAETLGALTVGRARARRRHSLLKGRRTRFQARRRTGKLTAETPVHAGEREIIARN